MTEKIEIALIDGTWLEGKRDQATSFTSGKGDYLSDVFRSDKLGHQTIPLAKKVYVPNSSILFVILEQ